MCARRRRGPLLRCFVPMAALPGALFLCGCATLLRAASAAHDGHQRPPSTSTCGVPGLSPSHSEHNSAGDQPCCNSCRWSSFTWRARTSLKSAATFYLENHGEKEAAAGGGWTAWTAFRANTTLDCGAYPNNGRDPIDQLVLLLQACPYPPAPLALLALRFTLLPPLLLQVDAAGAEPRVPITLEVRPGGSRASEPPYAINTTMAHVGSGPERHRLPHTTLVIMLRLARQNLTSIPVLQTESQASEPLFTAMATTTPPVTPPKNFTVHQGYHGLDDAAALGRWCVIGLQWSTPCLWCARHSRMKSPTFSSVAKLTLTPSPC
eukprot:COSAG05_NODE_811_length_7176_cov_2.226791_3_plen_321_part_00